MHFIIYLVYQINGIYDILCSLCILGLLDIPILNRIHLDMFLNELKEEERRMFAYWIMSNGLVRFFSKEQGMIRLTYAAEALLFLYELVVIHSLIFYKSMFVILASIYISCFL